MAACDAIVDDHVCADKWAREGDRCDADRDTDSAGEETTPTTTASDADSCDIAAEDELDSVSREGSVVVAAADLATDAEVDANTAPVAPQLTPGLYHDDLSDRCRVGGTAGEDEYATDDDCSNLARTPVPVTEAIAPAAVETCPDRGQSENAENDTDNCFDLKFAAEETLFVFDWDDTVLPSSWIQSQGLRLDDGSVVSQSQREVLAEVAAVVGDSLRRARQHGTVILVTNAERGWIELSCQKFLPVLAPFLENVKMISARTTYESVYCPMPLDWKVSAFETEIKDFFGEDSLTSETRPKNILSLGDGAHEREALMRTTASLPSCSAKSMKFVERPDLCQIIKQHELVKSWFERIVHHDGNLDLQIRCD